MITIAEPQLHSQPLHPAYAQAIAEVTHNSVDFIQHVAEGLLDILPYMDDRGITNIVLVTTKARSN